MSLIKAVICKKSGELFRFKTIFKKAIYICLLRMRERDNATKRQEANATTQ